MKVCSSCGAAYPVAQGFCPMDGTPLEDPGAPAAPPVADPRASPPAGASREDPLLGQVLDGRYRLVNRIGAGGMGVVYRARHVLIDKEIAVKVLRENHVQQSDVLERFLQEARLASSIRHPNVVEISDYGRMPNGSAYYVMEFLQGHSLAQQIDHGGRIDPRRAIAIASQIARGLGAAHARGIVHRDLKPDNVFLAPATDGGGERVKILDFGIARVVGKKTRITKIGAVVGTPEYMSPEQAQGADVDHRTDLYALGVITFEMLTGKVPFRGDTVLGTLTKQMFDAPPALRQADPSLPELPRCEYAVNRLMAKSRDERPSSAEDAIRLLEEAADQDLGGGAARSGKKRTVAIGSGSIEAHGPALGSGVVARGNAPGWPAAAAGDVAVVAPAMAAAAQSPSPAVVVREGTPAEFLSPTETRRRRTQAPIQAPMMQGADLPPVPLMVLGAAMFAGAVTFGVVRWMNPVLDHASKGEAAISAPGAAPTPPPPDVTAPTPAPGVAPPRPTSPDTVADDENTEQKAPDPEAPERAPGANPKRRPSKARPTAKKPRPARPAAPEKPDAAPKPPSKDPPDPDAVSIGDLKDPFSQN